MPPTPTSPRGSDAGHTLDLFQVLTPLRQHWLRFLLRWMVISGVCLLLGAFMSPGFQAKGTAYLDNLANHGGASASSSSTGNDALSGSMLSLLGSGSDLESEKGIVQTNDLALGVIKDLGLNTSLKGPSEYLPERPFLWQYYLDRDPNRFKRGLYIKDSNTNEKTYHRVKYDIKFTDATHYQILDYLNDDKPVGAGEIGQPATTSAVYFTLDAYTPVDIAPGTTFRLIIQPAQLILKGFSKALQVSGGGRMTRQDNLITLTYSCASPYQAQQVVETLLEKFVELNHGWDISVSHAIVTFTQNQLKTLESDMDHASQRLAMYQKASGMINLDKQEEEQVKSMIEAEVDLDKATVTVQNLEQLEKGLESGKPDMYLVSFIEDKMTGEMGYDLARLNGEIQAMETQYQGDYPKLDEAKASRDRLIRDMLASVKQGVIRARAQLADSAKIVNRYQQMFANVPEKAKVLADYLRATEVFQRVYLFLIQEQQKAEIAEGSSLSNIRIVEHPYVPIRESFPGNVVLVAICAVLGMLASGMSVIVPALRVRWFSSVEEVKEALPFPIFAVVPHRGSTPGRASPAIVETKLQSQFVESIRLLRANLQHTMAGRKHQTVLITSAMPQDGKSSITANLAVTMARSERIDGVLLIDVDMHHPSLHGVFGVNQSPGLSEYLNGTASLGEVIHSVDLGGGRHVDVICAGEVPPSPVELVDSQAMQNLLAYAKEHYTFALLDSPPYPLIATSSVLAPLADRVLSICRLGHTDRSLFRTHVEDLSSFCKHLGVIVNLRELGRRQGGSYGSGYGKYGGYGVKETSSFTMKPAAPGAGSGNPSAARPQGRGPAGTPEAKSTASAAEKSQGKS